MDVLFVSSIRLYAVIEYEGRNIQIDKSSRLLLQEINHFNFPINSEITPQFLLCKQIKVFDSADIHVPGGILVILNDWC